MKTRDKQMRFIFKCEAAAEEAYLQARTTAITYGRVTLADIHEIIGNHPCYNDTKIYWTPARFDRDIKVYTTTNGEWVMHLFDYLSSGSCDDVEETDGDIDDTRSVHISVTTRDMDDPDCILCSVFKYAREFCDRDVFINVY